MMHGWQHLRPEDREKILIGIERGEPVGGPYHVELDPIDICNADCFFCNSVEYRNGDIFHWQQLEPVVDELISGGLRSFRLAGGGEPTLYPHLDALCEKMAAAGVVLENLTTNGIRLNHKRIRSLLALAPTHYHISLNYTSPTQYERFMQIPGDRFETIISNIRTLNDELILSDKRDICQIHIQFFVHHSTIPDLQNMMDLAIALPVDTITLRSIHGLEPEEQLTAEDRAELLQVFPEIVERSRGRVFLMASLENYGMQNEVGAMLENLHDAESISQDKPRSDFCYIGWYSMAILGTGDVHPCCYLMPDPQVPAFGNLKRQTVQEVWHGEYYQKFRVEMRTAMIYRELTAGRQHKPVCSTPGCWDSTSCPMSYNLADAAFYQQANDVLDEVRWSPVDRATRLIQRTARRAGL